MWSITDVLVVLKITIASVLSLFARNSTFVTLNPFSSHEQRRAENDFPLLTIAQAILLAKMGEALLGLLGLEMQGQGP